MVNTEINIDNRAAVISIKDLKKSFETNIVLNGIDIEIFKGENIAVLGRSGSGKSVLIKIISGLLKPDSGIVKVLGREVDKLTEQELQELRLKIGFSFQSSALYDSMSVKENLAFPLVRNRLNLSEKDINIAIESVFKELVARWLHEKSNRNTGQIVEVNCAAIPSELIESELFGHEKGSFTSAIKQRIGKFEQANGGTLFLDEIGDMSLSAQAKVLRALQEGKITRVGGEKEINVDVRVVAATNKDLLKEVEEKNFRLDLYHRLGVILIHVPSLNERKDDIPLLVEKFLSDIALEYGQPKKIIDDKAINALLQHNWTGNIRELRNVVERLIILSGKAITADDVVSYVK